MSSPHATARQTNIIRRLSTHLAGQALPYSPLVIYPSDDKSHANGPTVRYSVSAGRNRVAGRYSSSQKAFDASLILVADIFWPDGTEAAALNVYEPDECADQVAHLLRYLTLQIQDYSSDPSNPSAVSDAYLRPLAQPVTRSLPPSNGYSRRQVVAEYQWFGAHSDAA